MSTDELAEVNGQGKRCVDEIADAQVDTVLYGCLFAVMANSHPAQPTQPERNHA